MRPEDRHEQARRLSESYRKATRKEKSTILEAFCTSTGLNRKYAISLLREPPEPRPKTRRTRRGRKKYGREVVEALERIWEAADGPWTVRLKAMLPLWLPHLGKQMKLSEATREALLRMSPRTMDRYLRPRRIGGRRRLYGRTKPGTLLKHHIPLRTDRWDVSEPGWGEIDLVSHCGGNAEGEFAHSLNLTDIHSTWVETRAVLGKAQVRVVDALDQIRRELPFRMLGIDSDNGSEFINNHVIAFCKKHTVQFTRGRPYKKDDNAHIEQKNWTHVRRLIGYERIDRAAAVDAMNDLYRNEWRWMMNLFQPSVQLVRKDRVGSRLRRRYDVPMTPLDRLLRDAGATLSPALRTLVKLRDSLDPFELSNQIQHKLDRIHRLAAPRPDASSSASARKASERLHPLLDPPPQGGGRHHPELPHAQT